MILPTYNYIYIFLCIVFCLWICITLLKLLLKPHKITHNNGVALQQELIVGGFSHPNYVSSMTRVPYHEPPPPPKATTNS